MFYNEKVWAAVDMDTQEKVYILPKMANWNIYLEGSDIPIRYQTALRE